MSAGFTESSTIQRSLVDWARQAGWEHIEGVELPRETTSLLVEEWVEDALVRLNPDLVDDRDNLDAIVTELRGAALAATTDGLLAANEVVTTMLRGDHAFTDIRTRKSVPRRFIDFDNPSSNHFVVADEVTIGTPGAGARRFDVVYYVNGLPLVVVETKSPTARNASWYTAARDITDVYQREFPYFFGPNVFCVATDGRELRYGSVGREASDWDVWGDMDGDPALVGPERVERDARLLLDPMMVLRILRSYVLFEHSAEHGTRKIVPRYPQVQAAEAIHHKVLTGDSGGLIWHYQGSGKTLLCAFAAVRLLQDPLAGNPTVIMLVDRKQLASQTRTQFQTAGMPRLEAPETSAGLRNLLRHDYRGVIVTTIHKFADVGHLNDRDSIVVLVDEAHRTQEGSLAEHMRDAVPNARFFGMTGTPIAEDDRNTFKLFGDPEDPDFIMSRYEPERSVADGTTVPVYVESRKVDFHVDQDALDADFEAFADERDLSDEDRAALTRKVARKRVLFSNPERVAAIATDMVDHYDAKFTRLGLKAQVVALDRQLVVAYKRSLETVIAERGLPYTVEINMTVGTSKGEPAEFAQYAMDEGEEERQKARFTDPYDPLTFLVVTAKLMTGFDAPNEGVLYLDKPLTRHTLFQAITRPNRKWTHPNGSVKKYGLVVDYVGMDASIREALETPDVETGKKRDTDTDQLAGQFVAKISALLNSFTGIDMDDDSFAALGDAAQRIPEGDVRDQFAKDFQRVQGIWEFLDPHTVLDKYRTEYRWLAKVYNSVHPSDVSQDLLWANLGPKTIELVHRHMHDVTVERRGRRAVITAEALATIREMAAQGEIDLDDPDGDNNEEVPDDLTVEEVMDSIEGRIKRRLASTDHPKVYESLAKRIEELRQQMLAHPEDAVDYLISALDVAKLTVRAERMEDAGTLAGQEALFDANIGALTQIVAEHKPDGAAVIVDDVAREIDTIVKAVSFSGWTDRSDADKKVRSELRQVLLRFGLPVTGEPFDSAYSYIHENY